MVKHGALWCFMTPRHRSYAPYSFHICFAAPATTRRLSSLLRPRKTSKSLLSSQSIAIMAKAKRKSVSSVAHAPPTSTVPPFLPSLVGSVPPSIKRRTSQRTQAANVPASRTNPDTNADVLDGPEALRASPDAEQKDERLEFGKIGVDAGKQIKDEDNDVPSLTGGDSDSSLSEMSDVESLVKPTSGKNASRGVKVKAETVKGTNSTAKAKDPQFLDPEAEGEEEANEEEIQAALSRPPPVNSDYLPLPWKGRLGYVSCQACSECY